MKSPYCNQDHPEGILVCPDTGRAFREPVTAGTHPADQAHTTAPAEETAQTAAIPQGRLSTEPARVLRTPIKKHTLACVVGGCLVIPLTIAGGLALNDRFRFTALAGKHCPKFDRVYLN